VVKTDNEQEKIRYSENSAVFRVNPKIYPVDVVYSAAYIMIDRAFILLDGDPEKEIEIMIQCKKPGQEIKTLVQEFNEELLNYSVYKVQSEKNKDLREILLKRVLITNEVINCMKELEKEMFLKNMEDPENIFKPWDAKEDEQPDKDNKAE
jgi:His-Xaa-Ser system protein HxsD